MSRAYTLLLCILTAACGRQETETSLTELRAKRQELRLQFNTLNNQVRPAETQALDSPGVQVAQADFRTALEAEMVRIDPQASEWFAQAEELGVALRTAPSDTTLTAEDKRRMAADLQRLERVMGPVQTQAMQDSQVAAAFRRLQDSVMETVMRIDPATRPILRDMRQLEIQIEELDRLIARRSGAPRPPVPD